MVSRPASMLARSSRFLASMLILSMESDRTSSERCCSSSSAPLVSRESSSNPSLSEVRGVRSSWAAILTKSSRALSTCFCSVMSLTSTSWYSTSPDAFFKGLTDDLNGTVLAENVCERPLELSHIAGHEKALVLLATSSWRASSS